jgi:hypothetical protein
MRSTESIGGASSAEWSAGAMDRERILLMLAAFWSLKCGQSAQDRQATALFDGADALFTFVRSSMSPSSISSRSAASASIEREPTSA